MTSFRGSVARNIILAAVVGSVVIVGFAYATIIVPGPPTNQKSTSTYFSSTSTRSTTTTTSFLSSQTATTTITNSTCSGTGTSNLCDPATDGMVRGVLYVGPAQPVCTPSGCGSINMSGYSLVVVYDCGATNPCPMIAFAAPLQANGSYSLELPTGSFKAETISPTCSWLGCSNSFPKSFAIVAGDITNLNITIDTGIR